MESLWPPGIRGPEEVVPQLDANVNAGAVGVKIAFEPGFAAPVWRLHPPEVERAIVEEAAKRNLPIYAHAERAEMVRRALAVKPHALVHGPIDGTPELAAEIAAAKIPVVTTLALFDAHEVVLHPEQAEEPHIRRTVPPLIRGADAGCVDGRAVRGRRGSRLCVWMRNFAVSVNPSALGAFAGFPKLAASCRHEETDADCAWREPLRARRLWRLGPPRARGWNSLYRRPFRTWRARPDDWCRNFEAPALRRIFGVSWTRRGRRVALPRHLGAGGRRAYR